MPFQRPKFQKCFRGGSPREPPTDADHRISLWNRMRAHINPPFCRDALVADTRQEPAFFIYSMMRTHSQVHIRGVHTRPEPDPTRKSGSFGLTCDYVGSGRVRVQTLIFGLRSGLKSQYSSFLSGMNFAINSANAGIYIRHLHFAHLKLIQILC